MVITRYHPIHALLYLVVSFLAAAMIFLTLGAPFIAVLEVIIYAGAIMVLFIFVVMMLRRVELRGGMLVAARADFVAAEPQLRTVRIVAIGAADVLVKHLAFQERRVFVHLVHDLAVGIIRG